LGCRKGDIQETTGWRNGGATPIVVMMLSRVAEFPFLEVDDVIKSCLAECWLLFVVFL